jgi:molybdate transport system substrate-binding protein
VRRRSAAVVAALLVASACGGSSGATSDAPEITVFAASSLTGAFGEIGRRFEDRDGASVTFNFLASSDLAAQIGQGAPADVFASADEANMDTVVEAGLVARSPEVFAHNRLEIVVAPGNPRAVRALKDLEDPSLVVSLCNEDCPAGRYARDILQQAGVRVEADSLETEVKGVVTRVSTGEADAGIVYATDVQAAERDVDGIEIPRDVNVVASYPIAVLQGGPDAADDFVDYVLSPKGQEVLEEYGFLPK